MTDKRMYIVDPQLQIGMTQYNSDLGMGIDVYTQNQQYVGVVTYVSDNKNGAGEQIYAIL